MTGGRVVQSAAERRSLWRVREDGAGLAARLVDGGESWPGWEDAAVAPEQLAAYLRDFRRLLDTHGLTGVLYGHFGAGCMHIRIARGVHQAGPVYLVDVNAERLKMSAEAVRPEETIDGSEVDVDPLPIASRRKILTRMLNNLRGIYRAR